MMTHAMLRALAARGHRVDVVLADRGGAPYVRDGVHVWPHRDKADPFRFLPDAHVIVAHVDSAARAVVLGETYRVPVVQVVHNTSASSAAALRRWPANLTVFNSEHAARALAGECGRWIIVRPPVDPAEYATTPGDAVTLVNLSAAKGANTFYALAERFPERRFLGVQGGYGAQILPAGPDDLPNVEVIGHVAPERMRDEVYARTRVLLMPSQFESWGRVGVEAMCSGIPVIAHPTPGLRESLGDAGTFVDRDDIDGWETALRRLLDGRRWRAASRRSLARAQELNPAQDLDTWCREVETIGRRADAVARLVR
ncbi:MAG: glycosyltransferase family 4 protein [Steroidobacteraceae bacterium]|nr:glycosyltransferase family 4 protein [Steroidobacteraceae bacterium]